MNFPGSIEHFAITSVSNFEPYTREFWFWSQIPVLFALRLIFYFTEKKLVSIKKPVETISKFVYGFFFVLT